MTTSRRLYGDANLIEEQLRQMELVETAAGGWASVYKNPETGAFWMKYYATAATQGGGYLTLLKLPVPTTDELIQIAIHTLFEDEMVAAILRLLDEEQIEKKDFRLPLIEKLEELNLANSEEKRRAQQLIKLAALDDPMNRRELLHKTAEEVKKEAAYFQRIAERAQRLLKLPE
ncbi:hypothetical protein [Pontibacter vulgaris]|uniref:hypothetical protein n=1 Tax=Pontibacter vulgaris TaxID=2905679 RepID=UPI001FA721CB|nr:hypothetical protein [Pontibacter vulgaris]